MALDRVAHVGGLAPLAGEEHRECESREPYLNPFPYAAAPVTGRA